MCPRFLNIQLVQFGEVLTEENRLLRSHNIEDNHLVATRFQPTTRYIERLLRTDVPETSDGMAIDIDLALAKVLHIEEGITDAFLLQIEIAPAVAPAIKDAATTGSCSLREGLDSRLIVIRDGQDGPSLEVPGELMPLLFSRNHHTLGDTLIILDGTTKVDATHGLDEDLQFLTLADRRELETLLIAHAG